MYKVIIRILADNVGCFRERVRETGDRIKLKLKTAAYLKLTRPGARGSLKP